jgi:hypothetical protein
MRSVCGPESRPSPCEIQPRNDGAQVLAQPLLLVGVQVGHELGGDLTSFVFHLGHRLAVGQGAEYRPAVFGMWRANHKACGLQRVQQAVTLRRPCMNCRKSL